MDNVTIVWIVMLLGAIMGTFVPYYLKCRQEAIEFDMMYAYGMVLNGIMITGGMIPDEVAALTIKVILTAFAAGYGIQAAINKAVSTLKS